MVRRTLTSSKEDYLEAILSLIGAKGFARVRDIADHLGVGRSAVSNALHTLSRHNLVVYEPYKLVTLTDKGSQAARAVQERHDVLRRFITDVLGMDADAADQAACRIEHNIDPAVLEGIGELTAFFAASKGKNPLPQRFAAFRADRKESDA
jgi:DtxR family Mn-dependent transcriptional regulator